jgi:hypothetical protein
MSDSVEAVEAVEAVAETPAETPAPAEKPKATRVHVPLKDFLRVTVQKRDEIDTFQKASDALGYTSLESFKQALDRNKKRYPAIFESVAAYPTKNGPSVATVDEAAALMAELTAEAEAADGEDADTPDTPAS